MNRRLRRASGCGLESTVSRREASSSCARNFRCRAGADGGNTCRRRLEVDHLGGCVRGLLLFALRQREQAGLLSKVEEARQQAARIWCLEAALSQVDAAQLKNRISSVVVDPREENTSRD